METLTLPTATPAVTNDSVRGDVANALQLLLTGNIVVALDAVQRRLESALTKLDQAAKVSTTPCLHCDASGTGLTGEPCAPCGSRGFFELSDEYFTDADEAYCCAMIEEWRQYLAEHPPEPGAKRQRGNMGIWTRVLSGIRAVRAGTCFDFRSHLSGVAIDGAHDDIRRAQLLARMSAYAVSTWSN